MRMGRTDGRRREEYLDNEFYNIFDLWYTGILERALWRGRLCIAGSLVIEDDGMWTFSPPKNRHDCHGTLVLHGCMVAPGRYDSRIMLNKGSNYKSLKASQHSFTHRLFQFQICLCSSGC